MAIDHLSSSQIKLYLQCPTKYRFQYIDLIPRAFRSSALAFGSALHSALSWFHKSRLNRVEVKAEHLFQVFEADWYSQTVESAIRYKDGDDPMRLLLMGKEMLSLYLRQNHPAVKGSEIPFTVPLISMDGKQQLGINLEGFLDLVEADDTIVEFKTSAQVMSPFDIHSMLQLSAYGYAYWKLYGKPPRAFRVVNFIKNKKIRVEVTETRRELADLETFFSIAMQVLRAIQEGIFYPRTGFWCKECEYQSLCPMWKGNHTTAALPGQAG
jgi:CRISPR/Cas system-associated exonuclease Cas4 (RecB family)